MNPAEAGHGFTTSPVSAEPSNHGFIASLTQFRIVPQLDRYPNIVRMAQTIPGKFLLLTTFGCLAWLNIHPFQIEIIAAAGLISYLPRYRRALLTTTSIYWVVVHPSMFDLPFIIARTHHGQSPGTARLLLDAWITLAVVFSLLALYFNAIRAKKHKLFVFRQPVACLIIVIFALLLAAARGNPNGSASAFIWELLAVSVPYLWYFAYMLKDALAKDADRPALQFGTLLPFWGGTNVPYAKGSANLRRCEARNPQELAIAQLKAIKLLVWTTLLRIVRFPVGLLTAHRGSAIANAIGLGGFHLGIPKLDVAIVTPNLSHTVAWLSLAVHFASALLSLSISGHVIVACCRMAGFNILRNTYRPLQSRTLVEFWNRYYYYFKELLVEFFFFPFFTRYFKKHLKLRVFASTLAAATFGNMIYHFLRDYRYVGQMGLWAGIAGFQTYSVYALVLGVGIGISQLRMLSGRKLTTVTSRWQRALESAAVLSFFCLLEIFDQEGRTIGLSACFRFLFHLFYVPV